MRITDTYRVTIDIMGIDVLALKKLSLVSHALADKIDQSAATTAAKEPD